MERINISVNSSICKRQILMARSQDKNREFRELNDG